jgi:hypothetical protein
MKHFHYCPKCHQSPPCEAPECAILGAGLNGQKAFSHHTVCAACEVMALTSRANPFEEVLSPKWFAAYNSIFPFNG